MSERKRTSVSIKNTPVQRALSRAKRSTLLLLFVVGIVGGFLYKAYFQEKPVTAPPTVSQQQ